MPATAKKSPATNTRGTQTVKDAATPNTLDKTCMKTLEKEITALKDDTESLALSVGIVFISVFAILIYFHLDAAYPFFNKE